MLTLLIRWFRKLTRRKSATPILTDAEEFAFQKRYKIDNGDPG